ncbi:unnamed protein product [Trichogramma brassicae]|uniref:Endonuclease n=1 Tax=Trichogramma brassicae TaxID=86971 RepID=A0A6H5IEM3_9HYME|nr:unnamed protein product [Trichogramma brassicae]
MEYDFEIVYRKGSLHYVPDALSRAFECDERSEFFAFERIEDEWYMKKLSEVKKSPSKYTNWYIEDGMLYKRSYNALLDPVSNAENSWRLVVPAEQRERVLTESHCLTSSGHLGAKKTYDRLACEYWWPGMWYAVEEYCNSCDVCQRYKVPQTGPKGLMTRRVVDRPWAVVAADMMEFPRSKNQNKYLLVFQDLFTRWIEIVPLRKANGVNVLRAFEELVLFRWETPEFLLTDNGKEFDNAVVWSATPTRSNGVRLPPLSGEQPEGLHRQSGRRWTSERGRRAPRETPARRQEPAKRRFCEAFDARIGGRDGLGGVRSARQLQLATAGVQQRTDADRRRASRQRRQASGVGTRQRTPSPGEGRRPNGGGEPLLEEETRAMLEQLVAARQPVEEWDGEAFEEVFRGSPEEEVLLLEEGEATATLRRSGETTEESARVPTPPLAPVQEPSALPLPPPVQQVSYVAGLHGLVFQPFAVQQQRLPQTEYPLDGQQQRQLRRPGPYQEQQQHRQLPRRQPQQHQREEVRVEVRPLSPVAGPSSLSGTRPHRLASEAKILEAWSRWGSCRGLTLPRGACFECHEPGHTRRQCRKPYNGDLCTNCGRRGVKVRHCPRCSRGWKKSQRNFHSKRAAARKQLWKALGGEGARTNILRICDVKYENELGEEVEIVAECEDVKPNINLLKVENIEDNSENHLLNMLRKNWHRHNEAERRHFCNELYELIRHWQGPLPDLRDVLRPEEIEDLLWRSAECECSNRPNVRRLALVVDLLARSGYNEILDLAADGDEPLVHRAAQRASWSFRDEWHAVVRELFKVYSMNCIDDDEYACTYFHAACSAGFDEVVKKFLELGRVDPNLLVRKTGDSPLHSAKTVEVAELLLRYGADANLTNANGSTPLHVFCKEKSKIDLVELLLTKKPTTIVDVDARDKEGNAPLHLALCNDNRKAIELLLKRGADPNLANDKGETPSRPIRVEARRRGDDDSSDTAARLARGYSNEDLIEFLPNWAATEGSTLLRVICKYYHGDDELIEAFFGQRDDNKLAEQVNARDGESGDTPLHLALRCGNDKSVEFLLRNGGIRIGPTRRARLRCTSSAKDITATTIATRPRRCSSSATPSTCRCGSTLETGTVARRCTRPAGTRR